MVIFGDFKGVRLGNHLCDFLKKDQQVRVLWRFVFKSSHSLEARMFKKNKEGKENKKKEKKKERGLLGFGAKKDEGNESKGVIGAAREMGKMERVAMFKQLHLKPDNKVCADCGEGPTTFLASTLGCFLCAGCAEVHKEVLPNNISIPVSLSEEALTERNAWINHPVAPLILIYTSFTGNTNRNAHWEAELSLPQSSKTKLAVYDKKETFIREKYLQSEFVREELYACKVKRKKNKKRWVCIDEEEKRVLIYASDPNQCAEDEEAETELNLKETTLQWELETATSPSFKLINKGNVYTVELDTPKGLFDLMFHIHRTWEDVVETSPFHLGKWLDRMGFQAALTAVDMNKIKEYCDDDEKYAVMRDDRNFTPLHTACLNGWVEVASLLLEYNVDVEFCNTDGAAPLHCFFEKDHGKDLATIQKFLDLVVAKKSGLDWNRRNNSNLTYLSLAVRSGREDLAKLLVNKGADPDIMDDTGASALLSAVEKNQLGVVRLMLDKGADIFQKTRGGKSALELAKEIEQQEMYQMLFQIWEERRIQNQTNVINEILSTEADYVDRLQVMVELYIRPLEKELGMSPKATKALFSNALEIYDAAKAFSADLNKLKDLSPEKKNVGERFVKNRNYFQLYIPYCTNQSISMKSLDVSMSHPHIAQFVRDKEAKNKERLRSEKIDGFLIKPLQRITRFPLLLRELQKYTPDTHYDASYLKEASDFLGEVVGKANEAKRERDHIDEITETFGNQGIQWSLTSRLVGEGKCAIFGVDTKLESTYWFLFTDVLLIAKPSKGAFKFKIENLVILSTLPLLWEVKGKEANKLQQFAFSIVLPDRANVKITICLKSKDERQAMMDLLSSYIAEYMSEHERKALLCAGKGLAMKGETGNIVVEEKDKDRPIFFEELLVEGKDPLAEDMSRKERDNIQFESKLLKRVGIEKEDNVFEKLKKGQRGHDLDRKGMFTAVRNRDINAIKTFLDQSPDYCHIRDKRDASPLHVACQMGHLEAIQLLIDQGSDLGQKDKKGNTPFHWFCRAKYDSAKEAELLLEGFSEAIDEGFIDFDSTEERGNTCLHCCIQGEGEGQLANWLIKKGKCDPNAQNKAGETPLFLAVQLNCLMATKVIMNGGGDVWVKTVTNETAVDAAHEVGDAKIWDEILKRLNNSNWKRPPPPKKPTNANNLGTKAFASKETKGRANSPAPGQNSTKSKRASLWVQPSSATSFSVEKSRENNRYSSRLSNPRTSTSPSSDLSSSDCSQPDLTSYGSSSSLPTITIEDGTILPYEEIKSRKDELDQASLEKYLSDQEFEEIFKQTKDEFYARPAWKRTMLKKKADLF